ncbi:MAG: hypothetical protein IJR15_02420 [Clostridiales bacterium]|nr:hypothetical protein [Clostridiales bacterium]
MRTQQQTIIMYGFLVSCILTIASLIVPAYYFEYGGSAFMEAETEAVRLITSYISWPIAIAALGGIAAILFKYSKRNILIAGGIQVVGLVYEIYKVSTAQSQLRDSSTLMGTLSDLYASIGGGSGIEIRLGPGFAMLIISAAAVAAFTVLCNILVDEY